VADAVRDLWCRRAVERQACTVGLSDRFSGDSPPDVEPEIIVEVEPPDYINDIAEEQAKRAINTGDTATLDRLEAEAELVDSKRDPECHGAGRHMPNCACTGEMRGPI
jgi:hypothetical protein